MRLATLACFLLLAGSPAAAQTASPPASAEGYRLGAGDKVRVTIFGEPSLTGEFEVSATGALAFPLIGGVKAQGLTPTALEAAIAAALRDGYLKDPKVSVQVLTYRPFYILGEVNKPGEYPYSAGLTVMNAVATGGGFTYRANTRRVRVRHLDEAAERDQPLTVSTPVAPGDTIRIRERYF